MKATVKLSNGYEATIDLNPTNTYTLVKRVGQTAFNLYSGLDEQTAIASLSAVLDNEPPQPNVSYYLEQD